MPPAWGNGQFEGEWEGGPLAAAGNGGTNAAPQDPHHVNTENYAMINYPPPPGDPAVQHMYPNGRSVQGPPEHEVLNQALSKPDSQMHQLTRARFLASQKERISDGSPLVTCSIEVQRSIWFRWNQGSSPDDIEWLSYLTWQISPESVSFWRILSSCVRICRYLDRLIEHPDCFLFCTYLSVSLSGLLRMYDRSL
ncbi:hypothetical protein BC827DRAFT_386538 [Russula dissimulans]|nr:hypothetical protein BC827DRAFT_386538 [Russula dissimulans]